jgi:hypothetical protein
MHKLPAERGDRLSIESAGVALLDYDRDGWPDICFTNAQSVEMAKSGQKARSALFHNNHTGTFTDVTDQAGVGYPCWANGVSVATTTTTAGQTSWSLVSTAWCFTATKAT